MTDTTSVADHYNAAAATYHRQYKRDALSSGADYPANYFRLQTLIQRIAETRLTSIFEVGVGEATPLATIASMGVRVAGCDISDAMLSKAQETFKANGLPPEAIEWGDIQDSTTLARQISRGPFDGVIAIGVLPHVANDQIAIANMSMLLRSGGRLFVEFRNKLFSLFTFNRYTKKFILDDLLRDVSSEIKNVVAAEIDRRLATTLPPLRTVGDDGTAPGYDIIPSKFHNPFELTEVVTRGGFSDVRIHWYHYHPAPPLLEHSLGSAFRKAAMALEHENSWRGYFLCSAGIVEAVKA